MIRFKLFQKFMYLLFFSLSTIYAQTDLTVTGTVQDKTGFLMPGVSVILKGTDRGVVTDFDGNYEFTKINEGDVLVFSYVGMKTVEKPVGNSLIINVTLQEESNELEQVVVIGYGSTSRKSLTSAISTISADQLEDQPVANLDQGIQGQVSGVTVTRSSGQPGGAVSVRIRGITSVTGSNEPLYIIDGINVTSAGNESFPFERFGGTGGQTVVSPLSALNPNDIESIQVLKDASATAIYGAQASNGVILITTKRGKLGKAKISYETYGGIQNVAKTYDLLNLREYAEYTNLARQSPTINLPTLPQFDDPSILGDGTDWQSEVFRSAPISNQQLSISGGKENTRFYASVNYFDQDGIVINSSLRRYGLRLNLDHTYNDRIKFGNNINFSNSLESVGLNDSRNGIISLALRQGPDIPVRNSDGSFGAPNGILGNNTALNPVASAEIRNNILERYKVNGNIYLEYKFFKGLTFRTDLGYDYNTSKNESFFPTFDFGSISNDTNIGFKSANEGFYYLFKNYLTYNGQYGNHGLNVLLGTEAQRSQFQGLTGQRSNFPSNDVDGLNTGDADASLAESFEGVSTIASYFSRVNYDFDQKYLLSASVRYDGSSKFGPGKRWGLFPSASAAWVVSNERFMEGISDTWNYFKIRGGYGTSGNQNVGNFLFLRLLRNNSTAFGSGFSLSNFSNPDIGWESLISPNLGVELGFFNNRIRLDVDVYEKISKDFLALTPSPGFLGVLNSLSFIGIQPPTQNFGEMRNRGIDVTLNTKNIEKDKFSWNSQVVFSLYRNEITELVNEGDEIFGIIQDEADILQVTRTSVGNPISQYYGYEVDGLFRSEEELANGPIPEGNRVNPAETWLGDIRFKDQLTVDTDGDGIPDAGDGIINDKDRVDIGDPNPDFTFSMTNSFKFGYFDFSVFFQGSYGNDIFNYTRIFTEGLNRFNANQSVAVLDRYTDSNTDGLLPRFNNGDKNGNNRVSDRFVEDGSYLRIQSVTLGCTLPSKVFGSNSFFEQIRVYTTLQNIYTFTDYSGYDPEVGSFNQNALLSGIDFGRYPVPRTITFGLNVQF